MESNSSTLLRVAPFVGLLICGSVGGVLMWAVGKSAFRPDGSKSPVVFFFAITSLVFGIVAPFALAAFVRSRVDGKANKQVVTIAGFALSFVFLLGLGVVGAVFLVDLGITTTFEAIALISAIAGVVYGGMVGWDLTSKAVERYIHSKEPDPW